MNTIVLFYVITFIYLVIIISWMLVRKRKFEAEAAKRGKFIRVESVANRTTDLLKKGYKLYESTFEWMSELCKHHRLTLDYDDEGKVAEVYKCGYARSGPDKPPLCCMDKCPVLSQHQNDVLRIKTVGEHNER